MTCYRIYTQRKNVKWVCQIVAEKFPGFTVYKAMGFWQGVSEKSVIIEIITNNSAAGYYIRKMCKKICGYNKQQEVMYTKSEIKMRAV